MPVRYTIVLTIGPGETRLSVVPMHWTLEKAWNGGRSDDQSSSLGDDILFWPINMIGYRLMDEADTNEYAWPDWNCTTYRCFIKGTDFSTRARAYALSQLIKEEIDSGNEVKRWRYVREQRQRAAISNQPIVLHELIFPKVTIVNSSPLRHMHGPRVAESNFRLPPQEAMRVPNRFRDRQIVQQTRTVTVPSANVTSNERRPPFLNPQRMQVYHSPENPWPQAAIGSAENTTETCLNLTPLKRAEYQLPYRFKQVDQTLGGHLYKV